MVKGTCAFVGCLTFGDVKEALAQARRTGKPILTDRNFNAFVIEQAQVVGTRKDKHIRLKFRDWENYQKLALEARSDFPGFVARHFTLTRKQQQALKTLSREDLKSIRSTIDYTLRKREIVFIRFEPAQSAAKSGFDSRTGTGVLYLGNEKGFWDAYKAAWKAIKEAVDWLIDKLDPLLGQGSGGASPNPNPQSSSEEDEHPEHLIPEP
jgi:hypothetical protein